MFYPLQKGCFLSLVFYSQAEAISHPANPLAQRGEPPSSTRCQILTSITCPARGLLQLSSFNFLQPRVLRSLGISRPAAQRWAKGHSPCSAHTFAAGQKISKETMLGAGLLGCFPHPSLELAEVSATHGCRVGSAGFAPRNLLALN